jgi:hypothetical protein
MSLTDFTDFWIWKKMDIKKDLCNRKYKNWEEFELLWNNIKDKKDEKPDKGTTLLTDYHYWKIKKPPIDFIVPSDDLLRNYYDDNIILNKYNFK